MRAIDMIISRAYLKLFGEKDAMIILLFHSLYEKKMDEKRFDPSQRISVANFRNILEHFSDNGYAFVSPDDIHEQKKGKKVLITFDDGYYNNILAIPVLKEFDAHAIVFVSSAYIVSGKSFWWDVVHRERSVQGASKKKIADEKGKIMKMRHDEIEAYLLSSFGPGSLSPISDEDRPFSSSELRDFSKEKHIRIGNHTSHHAILTNYSSEGMKNELEMAQKEIKEITGAMPSMVSYPNGKYDESTIEVVKGLGLSFGITIEPRKVYLPISTSIEQRLRLGKFITHDGADINKQLEYFRSEGSMIRSILGTRKKREAREK